MMMRLEETHLVSQAARGDSARLNMKMQHLSPQFKLQSCVLLRPVRGCLRIWMRVLRRGKV